MFRKLVLASVIPAALAAQQPTPPPIPAGTFKPITLAEALKLARENNVAATTTENQIRLANNAIRTTRAQLYIPSLDFRMGQGISAGDRIGQSGTLVPYTSVWSFNSGLSAGMTLFDGGKTFADLRARRADVQNQEASRVTTFANLEYNIKTQYNSVLAANEQESAARAQLELANQNLAVTVARVNAGAANVADSLASVVQVGNAQLNILTAQQQIRSASANLTRYVSTPYLVTATPADTADIARTPIDSSAVMALALNGPQIRQLQAQLTAAQANQRSARSAYLPTVSASMGLTGSGTHNAYGFGGSSPYPYSRSLNFSASYPIFNKWQRENQVQSAEIAADNAEAQLKDAQLQNQATVITALGLIRNTEAQVRIQQISIRASEEALRVNQLRYQIGSGTFVDVLTAQNNLVNARGALIRARLDYRNARAQIEQVIGRDLP